MHNLRWTDTATANLLAILKYIGADNPDAAEEIEGEIKAITSKLRQFPKMYKEGRVASTRELVVRPNYIVVYTTDDETITILRVLHSAQQWP